MNKIQTALSRVPEEIRILEFNKRKGELAKLRRTQFKKYPHSGDPIDAFDDDACILAGENQKGEITSSIRIVFDESNGLPADKLIKSEVDKLRQQGLVIAELSKFAIAPEARGMLRGYLWAFYEIAVMLGIDSFISINPSKDVSVYKKIYAAKVILADIGHSYGTKDTFSLLEYKIKKVKPCLSKWLGEELS